MTWGNRESRSVAAARRAGCRATLAVGVALAACAPALAEDGAGGLFMGVRAIGAVSEINDVETTGFTGPASIETDRDEVAGLGVVFGYAMRGVPLRVELEVTRRIRFDLDVRDAVPSAVIDNEINVATTSALFNALLEWRNSSDFTPFAGASLGWARNSTDNDRTAIATQIKTSHQNDEDNFAWGAMAGVDWKFAESWAAGLAYRYIDLGNVDTGLAPTGDRIVGDKYVSHDVLLSLIFHF